ncbi:hypothetical protein AOLI_G00321240 [Acnodon oligacanthus]
MTRGKRKEGIWSGGDLPLHSITSQARTRPPEGERKKKVINWEDSVRGPRVRSCRPGVEALGERGQQAPWAAEPTRDALTHAPQQMLRRGSKGPWEQVFRPPKCPQHTGLNTHTWRTQDPYPALHPKAACQRGCQKFGDTPI